MQTYEEITEADRGLSLMKSLATESGVMMVYDEEKVLV